MISKIQFFELKFNILLTFIYLFVAFNLSICTEISETGSEVSEDTNNGNSTIFSKTEEEIDGNNTLLQSNDPNKVGFYLYSNPKDLTEAKEIQIGDINSLFKSGYKKSNPPIFLIHGFLNNFTTKFSQTVKDGFLQNGYSSRTNILVVDWGMLSTPANQSAWMISHINDLSQDLFYQAAVANVPKVGKRVSDFIMFLTEAKYLTSPSEVHIIGFSLGAQISGFVGHYTKENNLTIGRITGLDPAGPLYQTEYNIVNRLDSSDAAFVDIVHSNQGQDGFYGSMGHADFYPNGGGPNQPNCIEIAISAIGTTATGSCAHNKAWMYYVKSLSEDIIACKCFTNADVICKTFCSQKVIFGHNCPSSTQGSYYFDIAVKESGSMMNDEPM